MKKTIYILLALSVGLLTTACSFHSEKTFETSIKGTVDFGKPKLPSTPKPAEGVQNQAGADTQNAPAPSSNGKACHKDEECNKKDELCIFSTCQSVSQIKTSSGFNDDFSNDPCAKHPCADCTKGTQKKTGISYGYNDINISASACVDCQFNDECNAGFRCVSFRCVEASTHTYCDFSNECLEGYTCNNSQCVKKVAEVPTEKATGDDSQKKVVNAPSSNGKACNKHEECNKADELCYWGTCQSVAHIKQTLGFNDDFSNDPCSEKTCVNCTEGKMKVSGMSYGVNDTDISASVCIECMFNDACKTGFRCLHEQCVPANETNSYCDFSHDCLEGYSCENEKCVKATTAP